MPVALLTETAAGEILQGVVTADMLQGVLDEVIGLLPIILPVSITFIGLRKGISFLFSALHSA